MNSYATKPRIVRINKLNLYTSLDYDDARLPTKYRCQLPDFDPRKPLQMGEFLGENVMFMLYDPVNYN